MIIIYWISFLFSKDYVGATVTVLVGLIAIFLYYKQKFDHKKDAAKIILLEIQSAERQITKANDYFVKNKTIQSDVFLMQNENWSKYNYLFLDDFQRDEWDKISEFYEKCHLFDEAVNYNNSFFTKNEQEIRINYQKIAADILIKNKEKILSTKDPIKTEKLQNDLIANIDVMIASYSSLMTKSKYLYYTPIKPITDAQIYLSGLNPNISLSSIGTKLDKISSRSIFNFLK